ncbi:hypothetical protein NDU88_004899 [Pleurodeles waltl]|uniref:Uncharacterized protein n=1 Tax=Pleurodeles waltl TaxID=8319 RepID=A0AAV7UGM9_PLEWA|nr:hypothetical protein NDU88_004899 [Pleurodeles waltl]
MEQYTTPVSLPQRPARSEVSGEVADEASSAGEPSRSELLAAIQGSRVALEGKRETVAVEVNLLRADLRKVSNKVKAADGTISELQSEVGTLRTQMAQATSTVGRLEAWQEDAEGRSEELGGASPSGPLAQEDRIGDHMVLGALQSPATGWRYSGKAQWRWCLLIRMSAQLRSRTWRQVGRLR